MLVQALVPWPQLTRSLGGIPDDWVVIRRSMLLSNVEYVPGDVLPKGVIQSRTRIQQLYEQRLIEPLQAPKGSKQQARERMEGLMRNANTDGMIGTPTAQTGAAFPGVVTSLEHLPFSTEPVAISEEADAHPEANLSPPAPASDSAINSARQSDGSVRLVQSVLSKVKPSFRRPSLGPNSNRSA